MFKMSNNENTNVTYESAQNKQDSVELNTKDFEKQAQLHYETNHGTDVQRKIKALMEDSASDVEDENSVQKSQQTPASQQQAQNNTVQNTATQSTQTGSSLFEQGKEDGIDEKLAKCFDSGSDQKPAKKSKRDKSVTSSSAKESEVQYEYTSASQNVEIMGNLRRELSVTLRQLGVTFVVTIISLIFDLIALNGKGAEFLIPGKYSTVFSLVSLQLMFFCVLAGLDDLKNGAKSLLGGKPSPEAAAFLTVLVISIHSILTSIFLAQNANAVTFCGIGSFAMLMTKLYKYLKIRCAIMSFQVVSLKDTKYIANKCDKQCAEAQAFDEFVDEQSEILQIEGCEFIDGFFKNLGQKSKNDRSVPLMSTIALAVSAVIFALVLVFSKNIYTSFSCFVGAFSALTPLSTFIANSLPMFFASTKVFKHRSAIIGETACEKLNSAAVMSFDDTLVFPPKAVKITKIKAFGNYKIDQTVIIMANVFKTAGGPLSVAFDNMLSPSSFTSNAVLKKVSPDGITVVVDQTEYIIGIRSFISFYGLDTPADEFDTSFLSNGGSVLYLAKKDELIAKFYIKYNLNSQFEGLLAALYKEGICAGIRSIDPCINNDLIIAKAPTAKCPVSVIKEHSDTQKETSKRKEAVVLSASTQAGFLHSFIIASKLKQLFSANYVIKVLGFAISAVCLLYFAFTKNFSDISLYTALLLQTIWMFPSVLLSVLYRWK